MQILTGPRVRADSRRRSLAQLHDSPARLASSILRTLARLQDPPARLASSILRTFAQLHDSPARLAGSVLPIRQLGEELADERFDGRAPVGRVQADRENHAFIDADGDVLHDEHSVGCNRVSAPVTSQRAIPSNCLPTPSGPCVEVDPAVQCGSTMSLRSDAALLGVTVALVAGVHAGAQPAGPGPEQVEFFETEIRPLLAEQCFQCHGAALGDAVRGAAARQPGRVARGGRLGAGGSAGRPRGERARAAGAGAAGADAADRRPRPGGRWRA